MLYTVSDLNLVTSGITERMSGLYNLQTKHGDIVMNGVIASTYTKLLVLSVAHAAVTPLRAVSEILGVDILATLIDSGLENVRGRSWVRAG
ncbi:hypothetical protein BWQ96_04395 [Gracilariopsis chorda]|uniref:Hedgehog protein Hint domain-containing protein n=1 Tax=Gracilariopsis chorda TaxID=448386 RepID=A0A2V3IUP4_9FLOR|nr:hypothetical protein BWQ96_04395 [Gracilariopsis chorda]|eukprot:PXF45858.1 hypothetical protein BWQ96_04395 [Gracilariopsis chorda]